MKKEILIGTSGWNYPHWIPKFYPKQLKSYEDLKFYSHYYNTVENNSSFYRIAKEVTYKKWFTSTPEDFVFSLKLNKLFTHNYRLIMDDERAEHLLEMLSNLQVLKNKLGCLLLQMPPSFKLDIPRVKSFLTILQKVLKKLDYKPDIAIELRHASWYTDEAYQLFKKYNVALVSAQSSRYPSERVVTADFLYIRFHGPKQLFASAYSTEEMQDWWKFIKNAKDIRRVYVYFNNDLGGHAIDNSRYLQELAGFELTKLINE